MRKLLSMIALLFVLFISSASTRFSQLWAHHSFAARYDANKPLKLHGVVAKVDWVNPHAWIYLDVQNQNGNIIHWTIETNSPSMLVKQGLTKETLVPGTQIVVDGCAAKTNEPTAMARTITVADGGANSPPKLGGATAKAKP